MLVMIARERENCNETERMNKKNWRKLDHGRSKLALLSCIVRQKKKRLHSISKVYSAGVNLAVLLNLKQKNSDWCFAGTMNNSYKINFSCYIYIKSYHISYELIY